MAVYRNNGMTLLQRRVVRLSVNDKEANLAHLGHGLGFLLCLKTWMAVMEDDCFEYNTEGIGQAVASEVEIYTEESTSANECNSSGPSSDD